MATIVAFHAHPDDEALLTGGTLAGLADEGHRVVIVTATDGFMGAAADPGARTRLDELAASAAVLGAARVAHLGYADSGHGPVLYPDPPAAPGAPARVRFARADTGLAAGQLAAILRDEHADLLLGYDAHGGYGHRDHVQVHRVGARAAALAGVRLLEATIPREFAAWLAGPARPRRRAAPGRRPAAVYLPRSAITHRVDVRRYAARKQAALAAHRSSLLARGRLAPAVRLAVALPPPVFGLLAGREWFAEPGGAPGAVRTDVLQAAA